MKKMSKKHFIIALEEIQEHYERLEKIDNILGHSGDPCTISNISNSMCDAFVNLLAEIFECESQLFYDVIFVTDSEKEDKISKLCSKLELE